MIDDSSIDIISCYNVFQHIPRKATQSYLKEFSRIIKPNGIIIIQFSGAQSTKDKRFNDVGLDTKDYKIQYTKDDIQILAMCSKLKIKKIDVDVKGDSEIWYWVAMGIYN